MTTPTFRRPQLWSAGLAVLLAGRLVLPLFAQIDAQYQTWAEILRNLHDRKADTRLKALETLNLAAYSAAADAVAPLLADPEADVRFEAVDTELTFFLNEPVGVAATDGKSPKHSRAQDAFDAGPLIRNGGIVPPSVLDALLRALADPAPRIRFDALHVLGVVAEPPIAPDTAATIAAGLDSADPTTRIATARVLGRLRVASAGDKLIAALNDSNTTEQKYATEALGLIKNERALGSLLERLDFYKSGDLAAETLLALARIGHASALEALRAHLADPDAAMRVAALEGLGRLKDDASSAAIAARRQKDSSPAVRMAATFAMAHFEDPDVATLAHGLTAADTYGQAVDYLLELGPAVRPALVALLGSTREVDLKTQLIHVLGFVGTKETVPALEPFLKDKNDRIAHASTDAIARLSR